MPVVKIKASSLIQRHVVDEKSFRRAFGEDLQARGFRMDLPFETQRADDGLVVSQDPPNRLPTNSMQVLPLLNRIGGGDVSAILELTGTLLAAKDDRAEILSKLEVDMPADGNAKMADYDAETEQGGEGARPGFSDRVVSGAQLANWKLCLKALILMGARQEPL